MLLDAFVLENAKRWGEVCTPEQRKDAETILSTDGPPSAFLTRSRSWSKTTDLAAMTGCAMLEQLPPNSKAYGFAADREQARLLHDSLAAFIKRTPELRTAFTIDSYKVTTNRTGVVFEAMPAEPSGTWGLRPMWLVLDELGQWGETSAPKVVYDAVTTSAAKMAGCRMTIITTASSPGHWSFAELEKFRDDPLWYTHEIDGPPPWLDQAKLEGERRRLPEATFQRFWQNKWVAGDDRFAVEDDIQAAITHTGAISSEIGRKYVLALDAGVHRDQTALTIAHNLRQETDEGWRDRVIVDLHHAWQPQKSKPVDLATVESWVREYAHAYNRAICVIDPMHTEHMIQNLTRSNLHVERFVFTPQSASKVALTLLALLRDRSISLPDDPALINELRNVQLIERAPGMWKLDHASNAHDDRVVATAMAAHFLVTERKTGGAKQQCRRCGAYAPDCICKDDVVVDRGGGLKLRGAHHLDQDGWTQRMKDAYANKEKWRAKRQKGVRGL